MSEGHSFKQHFLLFCREWPVTKEPAALWIALLGCIYTRAKAKAIISFDLCRCSCRRSMDTQIENNDTHWKRCRFHSNINAPLRHYHTERQAARQVAMSHWNALWCSKIGPRSIPNHHGKRQNFKAAARCSTLGVFIPLAFALTQCEYALGLWADLLNRSEMRLDNMDFIVQVDCCKC